MGTPTRFLPIAAAVAALALPAAAGAQSSAPPAPEENLGEKIERCLAIKDPNFLTPARATLFVRCMVLTRSAGPARLW